MKNDPEMVLIRIAERLGLPSHSNHQEIYRKIVELDDRARNAEEVLQQIQEALYPWESLRQR